MTLVILKKKECKSEYCSNSFAMAEKTHQCYQPEDCSLPKPNGERRGHFEDKFELIQGDKKLIIIIIKECTDQSLERRRE